MMNVLHVPARVVGGYLGGEINPYGDYITVRQSAAHAWTEVFIPDKGWVRVDPTLVVAPERLEQNPDGSFLYSAGSGTIPVHKKLAFMLEAANLKWEAWFTGYSFAAQKALDTAAGGRHGPGVMENDPDAIEPYPAGFGPFFPVFSAPVSPGKKRPGAEAYTLFCKRLARIGLVRPPNQGPVDFFNQIKTLRPDLAQKPGSSQICISRSGLPETGSKNQTKTTDNPCCHFKPSRQAGP
jgi:protein-glutamine gamma-glutamyltransferase